MTETPAQYEIKSLSDFLNVPAEKLPECLGDFEQWVALSQFYHASKELIDSGGSPKACRKFDDAEAKVLAIIGIVEQDTKTREDHPK